MPQNPRYECPRAGSMYQKFGDVYYCSYHDKYAKDRCQAFFDFQGSGMQCPELHTMIDQGRKYCDKHEPASEIPEVVDWRSRMTEWLTSVALAEPPREDGNEVKSAVLEPEPEPEQNPPNMQATPSKHEPHAGELDAEQEQDQVPASKEEPTLEQEPEQQTEPGHQHEHIAALYMQCNICLESHNATDMRNIESCGHQYKEACLQDFLRRKGVRKYNCTGCRAWLQSHQEPEAPF
ncbi:hypothetical protein P171DRAFT_498999 [Karstenula rhodostoma CBS 690.94]|uniref:RING-type domain-containing protein n=1 Tax=Karstenula rhodostoma CBS 690.94 TaxID=1392251 RepID=A0A9P4PBS0_9PLEO|nr:hypothetical protein P171DRAFT_498999 [Karstenula rhodostoma CBS 690.94]